jgi:hypothetical protein
MTWRTGTPPKGRYVVVDRIYGSMDLASYDPHPSLGWCIRGRWLGHDAALCWTPGPDYPTDDQLQTFRERG